MQPCEPSPPPASTYSPARPSPPRAACSARLPPSCAQRRERGEPHRGGPHTRVRTGCDVRTDFRGLQLLRGRHRCAGAQFRVRNPPAAHRQAAGDVRALRLLPACRRHRRRHAARRGEVLPAGGDPRPAGPDPGRGGRRRRHRPGRRRPRARRTPLPDPAGRPRRAHRRRPDGRPRRDLRDLGRPQGLLPLRGRSHRPALARRVRHGEHHGPGGVRGRARRGVRRHARPCPATHQHPPGRSRGRGQRAHLPASRGPRQVRLLGRFPR